MRGDQPLQRRAIVAMDADAARAGEIADDRIAGDRLAAACELGQQIADAFDHEAIRGPRRALGGAGQHFATVTWSRGDQVGVQFVTPFDIALLAKVKPEVATHQWTRPSYLKNGGQSDPDASKGWNSPSLSELRDDLEGFLKR